MASELRLTARVQPGHKIEIASPELEEGREVEVIVVMPPPRDEKPFSIAEFMASRPPSPMTPEEWEERDREFRAAREDWDR